MLKIAAVIVVAVIAGVLLYAATKPDSFRVQRSASIKAPPEEIFPLLNDLHQHAAWSPWEKKDPAMKRRHSGAANGEGAVYEWDGNNQIGQGRMEITESVQPSKVVMAMHFIKPFQAHNTAEFVLKPEGGTTTVTWAIYGPQPYFAKVFSLICSQDKMIGKEFEAGLATLKALVEA